MSLVEFLNQMIKDAIELEYQQRRFEVLQDKLEEKGWQGNIYWGHEGETVRFQRITGMPSCTPGRNSLTGAWTRPRCIRGANSKTVFVDDAQHMELPESIPCPEWPVREPVEVE